MNSEEAMRFLAWLMLECDEPESFWKAVYALEVHADCLGDDEFSLLCRALMQSPEACRRQAEAGVVGVAMSGQLH